MAAVTVRNLPEEIHLALKARAKRNGRSTEAEIRAILQEAAWPASRLLIGDRLAQIAQTYGTADLSQERAADDADQADFS